jgi:hypothetical protein
MSADTPQGRGYSFEKVFGAALGMKPRRGSGSLWYLKLDLGGDTIMIECKHTDASSYRMTKGLLRKIQRFCSGGQEPALAVDIDGEVYVIQKAGDWIASRTVDASKFIQPQKGDIKRATGKIPALMRGDGPI